MIIKIPFKTPTVNHLYFNWNNRRIMTKEARNLKVEIKELINKTDKGIELLVFIQKRLL